MAKQTLYRFFDKDNNLLYIGISINAYNRAKQHSKSKDWFEEVTNITLELYPDREAVEEAEVLAIRTENPKYNIVRHNVKPTFEQQVDTLMDLFSELSSEEAALAMRGAFEGYRQLRTLGATNG